MSKSRDVPKGVEGFHPKGDRKGAPGALWDVPRGSKSGERIMSRQERTSLTYGRIRGEGRSGSSK